jgi:hypothetical protein
MTTKPEVLSEEAVRNLRPQTSSVSIELSAAWFNDLCDSHEALRAERDAAQAGLADRNRALAYARVVRIERERDALAKKLSAAEEALREYLTQHEKDAGVYGTPHNCLCSACEDARAYFAVNNSTEALEGREVLHPRYPRHAASTSAGPPNSTEAGEGTRSSLGTKCPTVLASPMQNGVSAGGVAGPAFVDPRDECERLREYWTEESRRYASNADYWRTRAETAEARCAELEAGVRDIARIAAFHHRDGVVNIARALLAKPPATQDSNFADCHLCNCRYEKVYQHTCIPATTVAEMKS